MHCKNMQREWNVKNLSQYGCYYVCKLFDINLVNVVFINSCDAFRLLFALFASTLNNSYSSSHSDFVLHKWMNEWITKQPKEQWTPWKNKNTHNRMEMECSNFSFVWITCSRRLTSTNLFIFTWFMCVFVCLCDVRIQKSKWCKQKRNRQR